MSRRLVVTHTDPVPSEAAATELIRSRGYEHVFTLDVAPEDTEPHWHDFDTFIMLLSGSMTVFDDEAGERFECRAGTFVETAGNILHHELQSGYRAVIGFGCDPMKLTRPVKKSPADQPA
jgi:hypothetical protein